MKKSEVLAAIRNVGLVPVLRAANETEAFALAEAIVAGGVTVLEVTMTVPNAVSLVTRLVRQQPELLIGAGTVLDSEQASACIDAGAQFVVSPALNIKTIDFCRQRDVAVLPGALTPTEIVTAWQAGADIVKVFPAGALGGANYLRSLKAPLPQIRMIPTGGVSLATARDFLAAGAYALGVGADLVDARAIADRRPELISQKARAYLKVVEDFQVGSV